MTVLNAKATPLAFIAILVLMVPLIAWPCPAGTEARYLEYAVNSCFLDGSPRYIEADQGGGCPSGFIERTDPQGQWYCSNGKVDAYSFADGCPDHFLAGMDDIGSAACLDRSGSVVVELVDHLE